MRTHGPAVSLRTGGSRVWHAIDLHGITLLVRRQVRPREPGDDSRAPRCENLCEIADMAIRPLKRKRDGMARPSGGGDRWRPRPRPSQGPGPGPTAAPRGRE